ncbi:MULTISPECIES: HU family DNA-binding protein [unclassified Butyrivibrio]|jgi:DNA-binding protein HU-beta|uniref:HU family DNA-binding protein n=1 Tax=unclassified Butyrivibrio TaxID=2639466 RepID=UPI0003FD352A|nr:MULTISPECIES: HU family DNA-binding protein [unclassified Butyrivibrio]SCX97357.1 DNA-binding protein HU-beta [Butyrivibrio sp. INlla14]
MNKTELVEAIAKATKLSKKDSEKAVKAFTEVVTKELKKKGKVQLVGFGTFETAKRAARTGKNPQTGATLKIPAATVPKFKAGKALKEAVNKK